MNRGVRYWAGKWQAYIQYKGKQIHLGMFGTETEAAKTYDLAAIKYHGDKAKLNCRRITAKEERIYRLCSPNFFGLTYKATAKLMDMSKDGIYHAMKRIKRKCPSLFPIKYPPVGVPLSYKSWMDVEIVMKF